MERLRLTREEFAKKIDHTALKAEATETDIKLLSEQATEHHFFSVCVNPDRVSLASSVLRERSAYDVKIAAVVGFPLGANKSIVKAIEAEKAVEDGASEIDMVANIGRLLDGNYRYVEEDINEVLKAIPFHVLLKVIIETAALPEDVRKDAAKIVASTNAAFVKTSTGFHKNGGASIKDVLLLKSVVGETKKIKAAGGIASLETALQMIEAGADRLGMSASVPIMQEFPLEGDVTILKKEPQKD
jgi:deoxyribose-phosphate aldolase